MRFDPKRKVQLVGAIILEKQTVISDSLGVGLSQLALNTQHFSLPEPSAHDRKRIQKGVSFRFGNQQRAYQDTRYAQDSEMKPFSGARKRAPSRV